MKGATKREIVVVTSMAGERFVGGLFGFLGTVWVVSAAVPSFGFWPLLGAGLLGQIVGRRLAT